MVIEISRDIDNYQETVVLGLTAKQLIFSVASIGVGGGLILALYNFIGLTASAYIAIPVVSPIALGGFYTYNGMSFYEIMNRKLRLLFGNQALTYVSTESEEEIRTLRVEEANKAKLNSQKRKGSDANVKQSKRGCDYH